MGPVDYNREQRFYEIICDLLLGVSVSSSELSVAKAPQARMKAISAGRPRSTVVPMFELGSAWTFNRRGTGAAGEDAMIDEYVVDYEEYPAIGSGGITHLGKNSRSSPVRAARAWSRRLFTPMKNWRIMTTTR